MWRSRQTSIAAELSELLNWKPAKQLEPRRVDLTALDICSVDHADCTVIDDALHFRQVSEGLYEVGVHIADVSHFVCAGSALDLEASKRGTSVYLCNRRIDMLPEVLSSDLCSLRGNVLRYAFSVIWELDEKAEIRSTRFTKSLIRSRAALTYQQAQDLVNGKEVEVKNKQRFATCGEDEEVEIPIEKSVLAKLTDSLRGLMRLSKIIREGRRRRGSLTVDGMIEEFMVLANTSVAKYIFAKLPNVAMLRTCPTLNTICNIRAKYFIAGTVSTDKCLHYESSIPVYTHFTSPIRRYADLVVHRQLAASLGILQGGHVEKTFNCAHLMNVCDEINRKEASLKRPKKIKIGGAKPAYDNCNTFFDNQSSDNVQQQREGDCNPRGQTTKGYVEII